MKKLLALLLCVFVVMSFVTFATEGGEPPVEDTPTEDVTPGEAPEDPENPGETPEDPENPGETPEDPENPGETPEETPDCDFNEDGKVDIYDFHILCQEVGDRTPVEKYDLDEDGEITKEDVAIFVTVWEAEF